MLNIDPHDQTYVESQLAGLPAIFRCELLKGYKRQKTRFDANTWIRLKRQAIAQAIGVNPFALVLDADEDALRQQASKLAEINSHIVLLSAGTNAAYQKALNFVEGKRLRPPAPIELTEPGYRSAIARMTCKDWWLKKLRNRQVRDVETVARILGLVNVKRGLYASDITVLKRRAQKAYHEQLLSSTLVVNEWGQQYSLKELSELNVSNPAIRKAELMARMRGFEELSKAQGDEALFLTMTCPSRFHAHLGTSGRPNPKWDGSTPAQAQHYLCSTFACIRSHLQREEIRLYGFRVAEPHHDGTPHWHLLLFVKPDQRKRVEAIFRQHCFKVDGNEPGAAEHRFKVVRIDPAKGSATGYIAKYVSKNINGEGLDVGVYGENPIEAAERVEAWAACWRIRQFQQIGGPSVTVWRELRRMRPIAGLSDRLKAIREAADQSDWQGYTRLMGGAFAALKDRPLRIYYELKHSKETGELSMGAYGDRFIKCLKGLLHEGQSIITRRFSWKVLKAGTAFNTSLGVL
ncbi:replication endonuclease [Gallaecimonas xiamenensis]|uniref:Replication protein A n=1 Tax=Gallaecimonas xiamenensis 3-C-1 TaxID=745411 RepID=K2JHW2_9GAMM|nr:replication endonuclease [Gallaecimonas xiamenensis]EKE70224.1 replication protein A [Gallaecimonas xiamenensis 3-C-1]